MVLLFFVLLSLFLLLSAVPLPSVSLLLNCLDECTMFILNLIPHLDKKASASLTQGKSSINMNVKIFFVFWATIEKLVHQYCCTV